MNNYYCKNCNTVIGTWYDEYKWHSLSCIFTESKNFNSIKFLNCKNCKKFIGILCFFVCKNCFGKDTIFEEKNLFDWFQQYKKIIEKYLNINYACKICDNEKFRCQYWFFEELTSYK